NSFTSASMAVPSGPVNGLQNSTSPACTLIGARVAAVMARADATICLMRMFSLPVARSHSHDLALYATDILVSKSIGGCGSFTLSRVIVGRTQRCKYRIEQVF